MKKKVKFKAPSFAHELSKGMEDTRIYKVTHEQRKKDIDNKYERKY